MDRVVVEARGRWMRGAVLAGAVFAAVAMSPAQAALVSVDFGTTTVTNGSGPSPTFSGAEAAATAANARFGAANVWNGIGLPEYSQGAVTNPTFSHLLDNTGAATGVGLSLTGGVKGFSGFNSSSTNALTKDYLFFNSGNNTASSLSFVISGLVAGAKYDFFVYGGAPGGRSFDMKVDAASTKTVAGSNATAFFDDLIAAADGTISGSLIPAPDDVIVIDPTTTIVLQQEVNWAGFQIVDNQPVVQPPVTGVPEPASLALVGTSLAGLFAMRRRRS